jgi:hypothetical protein
VKGVETNLEQATKTNGCYQRIKYFFNTGHLHASHQSGDFFFEDRTYVVELSSNIIIKPIPAVKIAYETHITGRYCPVRETTIPETADMTAHPRENGSILGGRSDLRLNRWRSCLKVLLNASLGSGCTEYLEI